MEASEPDKPSLDPGSTPSATSPVAPARAPRGPGLLAGALAAAAMMLVAALSYGLWTYTDLDEDGLDVRQERRLGTDPVYDDTDRDGVGDGWEHERALDPRSADSDLDGLADRTELENRSNPRSADTDADGLRDADEGLDADCDGDGLLALREDDDDDDRRRDAVESPASRCDPDVDRDGVRDGDEGALSCVLVTDCDADGLDDLYERNTTFDALNPDTFGVGLEDAILDAYQRRGQQPSPDADDDGIPDGWEDQDGLIQWGAFTPTKGTRDLLVEFLRVTGPDSGRHQALSFTPAYDAVRDLFLSEAGIRLQWVETRIAIPAEQIPALIPSSQSAYYEDVLNRSAYAANPYVTTVVMNPQHDQRDVLHAGVAPIRGMLAAVDYGVHVRFRFTLDDQNLYMMPLLESAIQANRLDVVRAFGWSTGGYTSSGEMFVDGGEYNLVWRPYWFRTAPRVITDDGDTFPLAFHSATVDHAQLAFTIAHEIGHTLGLCHLDLPDCLAGIQPTDLPHLATSTMYPASRGLHFLPSEWANAGRFLTCPAHGPIRILAENGTRAQLIDEKYGYALADVLNVGLRECGDFAAIEADLDPYLTPLQYDPPTTDLDPPAAQASATASIVYLAGSLGAVILSGAVLGVFAVHRLRPRT